MRRLVPLLVVTLGAALALAPDGRPETPTKRARLIATQERIEDARTSLARDHDIYVGGTGQTGDAVSVDLYNPSPANRRYVRRRFGPLVRVDRRPAGEFVACSGFIGPRNEAGPTTVPDVAGLALVDAERALVAAGLRFGIGCRTDADDEPAAPGRFTPEALGRVVAQCPRAGTSVAPSTPVMLGASSALPGGFRYRFGPYWHPEGVYGAPCKDGLTLEDPPTPPEAQVRSPRGYPVQVPAGGTPVQLAGAGTTLVWTTVPVGREESGGKRFTLHTRSPDGTTTAARVNPPKPIARLTAGTDRAGRLVVLAVAYRRGSIDHPDLVDADVVTIDPGSGAVAPVAGLARGAVAETAVALHAGRLAVARRPERRLRRRPGAKPVSSLWTAALRGGSRPRAVRLRRLGAARRFVAPDTRVAELALTGGGRLAAIVEDPRRLGGVVQRLWLLDARGARAVPDTRGVPDSEWVGSLSWQDGRRLWFGRAAGGRAAQVRLDAVTGGRERFRRLGLPDATVWAGGDVGLVAESSFWPDPATRPATLFATGPLPDAP